MGSYEVRLKLEKIFKLLRQVLVSLVPGLSGHETRFW